MVQQMSLLALQLLNWVANIVLCASGTTFFLYIYGRGSSAVHKFDLLTHWALKFGLAAFVAGSFFSVITFSTPQESEVVMNVGLASIFSWAVLFHKKYFV